MYNIMKQGIYTVCIGTAIYMRLYILVEYPYKVARGLEDAQRLIFVTIAYYRKYYILRTSRPAIRKYYTIPHRQTKYLTNEVNNVSGLREIPS